LFARSAAEEKCCVSDRYHLDKPTKHHFDKHALDLIEELPADGADQLLTTKQTAALIRMSPVTLEIYRGLGAGPPFIRIGRTVRYRRSDLIGWLRERAFASTDQYAERDREHNRRQGRPRGSKVIDGVVYVPQAAPADEATSISGADEESERAQMMAWAGLPNERRL
jgi:hypothetical protein